MFSLSGVIEFLGGKVSYSNTRIVIESCRWIPVEREKMRYIVLKYDLDHVIQVNIHRLSTTGKNDL